MKPRPSQTSDKFGVWVCPLLPGRGPILLFLSFILLLFFLSFFSFFFGFEFGRGG